MRVAELIVFQTVFKSFLFCLRYFSALSLRERERGGGGGERERERERGEGEREREREGGERESATTAPESLFFNSAQ